MKIRTMAAPRTPLATFDSGEYLSGLEFYETDRPIRDEDRDGLAQFTHFLAFLALQAKSSKWAVSMVRRGTLAYRALESHFSQLEGWQELAEAEDGLHYRRLVSFLMQHFPPHPPKGQGT
ncbi:MAG: hypothetical protein AB1705_15325 [Verrucomicrobiota bacterium]